MHTAVSDVPDAKRMGIPSMLTNSGTIMKPPPTPTYPLMKPATTPMSATFATYLGVSLIAGASRGAACAPAALEPPAATGAVAARLAAAASPVAPAAPTAAASLVVAFFSHALRLPFAAPPFGAASAFFSIVNDEYITTTAAAPIIAQAGDTFAAHTPTGERHAPVRPHTIPTRGRDVLFLACFHMPEIDVGTMVNSEVAVAAMGSMPKARRNRGTITVPPPMPKSPESTPTPTPTSAAMKNETINELPVNPILRCPY